MSEVLCVCAASIQADLWPPSLLLSRLHGCQKVKSISASLWLMEIPSLLGFQEVSCPVRGSSLLDFATSGAALAAPPLPSSFLISQRSNRWLVKQFVCFELLGVGKGEGTCSAGLQRTGKQFQISHWQQNIYLWTISLCLRQWMYQPFSWHPSPALLTSGLGDDCFMVTPCSLTYFHEMLREFPKKIIISQTVWNLLCLKEHTLFITDQSSIGRKKWRVKIISCHIPLYWEDSCLQWFSLFTSLNLAWSLG